MVEVCLRVQLCINLLSNKLVCSLFSRLDDKDDNPSDDAGPRFYDGFSETQNDSQVLSKFCSIWSLFFPTYLYWSLILLALQLSTFTILTVEK